MPRIGAASARRYAELFARVDGEPGDLDEPAFALADVARGRELAGVLGRNCITCHPFAGQRALGPQGMDLALQHERMTAAGFREWLLQPATVRPGTRMPAFWWKGDDADRRDVDALRTWLSVGHAAPLPAGLGAAAGSLVLEPDERPRLHGAFLKGLSARCIAVGSPERTHYAFDVEHARLAWLWRGAFVDASGTWSGRAGRLLTPVGEDWVVLDDVAVASEPEARRQVVGHRIAADGHPVFAVRCGEVEYEDGCRPRLAAGGSEVVRTLRCVHGTLRLELPAARGRLQWFVGGAPAAAHHVLEPGALLEIVYRW
jgi:mono/diheme cytochrome c family protein